MTGYYRVNYDTKNWKKIAKYLNSMEYTKIHVLNRAQIIDDAYHFLITRKINSSVFWEITNYLSQETNFIAWYPMIKALEHMSSVLPLSDKRVYDIKVILNFVNRNIKILLRKVLVNALICIYALKDTIFLFHINKSYKNI